MIINIFLLPAGVYFNRLFDSKGKKTSVRVPLADFQLRAAFASFATQEGVS